MERKEELEAVCAIFGHEIKVDKSNQYGDWLIEMSVNSGSAECQAASSSAFHRSLTVLLQISLPARYPEESARVQIRKPRGLAEDEVETLEAQISTFLTANLGHPILFEIFQLVLDFLDAQTSSSIPCSICLTPFTAEDSVSATQCGHHFHSGCLGNHIRHIRDNNAKLSRELPQPFLKDALQFPFCPVCRSDVSYLNLDGETIPEPKSQVLLPVNLEGWREHQKQMMDIFQRQKEKGGIIDLEQDRQRFLITEDTRVEMPLQEKKEEEKPKEGGRWNLGKSTDQRPRGRRTFWNGPRRNKWRGGSRGGKLEASEEGPSFGGKFENLNLGERGGLGGRNGRFPYHRGRGRNWRGKFENEKKSDE